MNPKLIHKLCLGTAQFGMDYGIANKRGRPSKGEIFEILEYAHKAGINTLDTAYSYGSSEEIIGEYLSAYGNNFNIISKMPHLDESNSRDVGKYFSETLKKLKIQKIYGYMVHKFDDLITCKDLWTEIEFLKQQRLTDKIGVSLYKPEELEYLLNNEISFDIVQVPYNIFDHRFENYFPILKERNVEIHIRSVFLQGLFFSETNKIDEKFYTAKDKISKLCNIKKKYKIPIHTLCLCFNLLNSNIDKVVFGVDYCGQLKQNLDSLKSINKVQGIYDLLESLKFHDESVILPYNWK